MTYDASASQSVGAVSGAHEKIRSELTEVLGRLGETNTALQGIVGQASSGLGALDAALAEKLRDMRSAIEQASTDLTRVTGVASSVVGDAQALVGAVDEHSASLAQSASELARTQAELDHTLSARRSSLAELLTQLEARRDDFDNVLTSFSGLVENAFRQSESRAREIGSFLAEASQATAASVEEQFGEIRAATGRERERTAAALRAAYEQANEQMTRLFGEATERFSTAAADIRAMTAEIQRELETTREQVSRGVADLPRETAEIFYPMPFRDSLQRHAKSRGVDPRFVLSIARQESSYNPRVKSNAAARGLMQFISDTSDQIAAQLRLRDFEQSDLYNADTAILFGSQYMKNLFAEFGTPQAVAASYNGSEASVRRWLARAKSRDVDRFVTEVLKRETKDYVFKVTGNYLAYQKIYPGN